LCFLADGPVSKSSCFLGDPPPDPRFLASLGALSLLHLRNYLGEVQEVMSSCFLEEEKLANLLLTGPWDLFAPPRQLWGCTGDSAPSEARKRGFGGGSPRSTIANSLLTVLRTCLLSQGSFAVGMMTDAPDGLPWLYELNLEIQLAGRKRLLPHYNSDCYSITWFSVTTDLLRCSTIRFRRLESSGVKNSSQLLNRL
jgi:hypothetical protein